MNNKTNKNKLNKINKNIKNIRNIIRRGRRLRRRRRVIRRVRRRRRIIRRRVALARATNYRRYMRVVRTDNTTMVVSGMDLVYSIPDEQILEGSKVLTIIPANPAYWKGTRVSALALGYQQYRPLKFVIHYVPTVAATSKGNIIGGTIWTNNSINEEDLQQSLITSSGGMSTQVYVGATATVKCRDNLSQNLYNIGSELDGSANPFYYVAIGVGNFENENRTMPGYFWVSYTYSFKNPIGNNTIYKNLGMVSLKDMTYKTNTTALLCQYKKFVVDKVEKKVNIFATLQIDQDGLGGLVATYNGDYVPLEQNDKLWVFQNYTTDEKPEERQPLQYIIKADVLVELQGQVVLNNHTWYLMKKNNQSFCYLYMCFYDSVTVDSNQYEFIGVMHANSLAQFDELELRKVESWIRNEVVDEHDVAKGSQAIEFEMNNEHQQIYLRGPDANLAKQHEDDDSYEEYEEELEVPEDNVKIHFVGKKNNKERIFGDAKNKNNLPK